MSIERRRGGERREERGVLKRSMEERYRERDKERGKRYFSRLFLSSVFFSIVSK